ncbi:MAG: hypothetical protein IJ501_06205 [Bacilli bacterium]|nr:hypothetical protein [Bacilli bacterium]
MKTSNLIWGIVLVILGFIFGLNALEITNINLFFKGWWTLFIIVPCLIGLYNGKDITGNAIGVIIGLFLLLICQGIVDLTILFKLFIPIVLVVIGLTLIFKDKLNDKLRKEIKSINNKKIIEYYATFSGSDLDFSNKDFYGCELNAVFGGIKCDLRKSKIKDKSKITANAIFGGIDIYVPEDVVVKVVSTSIFGGVSKKNKEDNKGDKVLYIECLSLFGGVDIK